MPKQRKIPLRKCIACQESIEKKGLFRIVRSPEGEVFLDLTGKKNGRGAYLSKKAECVQKAKNKNLLSRQLGVSVPEHVFDEMFDYLKTHTADVQ
ncbi:YlxR family protein [Sporolactobacillus shoreicorticis]|uniref:RNase P modulator RnpM n=1 Tax=Sporolactobacillus shoreicorticis TaxID=1923877 RepID=A0ABW5S8H5_9BACL|nr:YlxR family protein [Sporolactobacillus shoreicorticis]MCO7125958.1 YlxR family protein [Sporolactobacillus shoreicorticis]